MSPNVFPMGDARGDANDGDTPLDDSGHPKGQLLKNVTRITGQDA